MSCIEIYNNNGLSYVVDIEYKTPRGALFKQTRSLSARLFLILAGAFTTLPVTRRRAPLDVDVVELLAQADASMPASNIWIWIIVARSRRLSQR